MKYLANRGFWRAQGQKFIPYVGGSNLKVRYDAWSGQWKWLGGKATANLIDDVLTLSLDSVVPRNSKGTWLAFPSNSWLYDDISNAPLHAKSTEYVQAIVDDITPYYNGVAALNIAQYNSEIYAVKGSVTNKVDMGFNDCQNKGSLPPDFAPALQQVPIPPHAEPATGNDANLTIFDVETGDLWEFWKAVKNGPADWDACWGGKTNIYTSQDATFPGFTGSTATGISQTALIVSIDEARRGAINHCVGFVMLKPQSGYVWPARRGDGYLQDVDHPKEGTRFRLPANLDLSQYNLHPLALAIAEAAKVHGLILFDKAGAVSITCESGKRYVDAGLDNPWDEILNGTPGYSVLKRFPWSELEAIVDDYNRP